MIKKPIFNFYLDRRRRKEDQGILKVRFSYGARAYVSTTLKFTKEQWAVIQDRTVNSDIQLGLDKKSLTQIRKDVDQLGLRANEIIEKVINTETKFTAQNLADMFYEYSPSSISKLSISKLFEEKINNTKQSQKAQKTIESYKNAYKAIIKYVIHHKGLKARDNSDELKRIAENFLITEIDSETIRKMEDFLVGGEKMSKATFHSYMLNLRAVFNLAIDKELISLKQYPFKKTNSQNYFKIRTAIKAKKALSEEDLKLIYSIRTKLTKSQERALNYFILSFLLSGANLIDIALLSKENLNTEFNTLSFHRKKTENNVDDIEKISIEITEIHQEIISAISSKDSNSEFLFDILDNVEEKEERLIRSKVSSQLSYFGKAYRLIADLAGTKRFTYSYARHSFATISLKNSISLEIIGKAMGHTNVNTTKRYVSSLIPLEDSNLKNLKLNIFKNNAL